MENNIITQLFGTWAMDITTGTILFRLGLSFFLAAIIGWERSNKRHSAGLRTFIIITLASTSAALIEASLHDSDYLASSIAAATIIGIALISGYPISFSSKGQIRGVTTSAGLWSCGIMGLSIGLGFYSVGIVCFIILFFSLSALPILEKYLKDRSNHFEIHLELKSRSDLHNFSTTIRRLGMRIDAIEVNPAYFHSGVSVYSVSFTISSKELKKYKNHNDIIEALRSLEYVSYIEEME